MENKERYKRLLIILSSVVIIALQAVIFMYVWYGVFDDEGANYYNRGNYVLISIYTVLLYLFYKIYGGFKIGHNKLLPMLYSQTLSVICVNTITYFLLSLIGRWKFMTNVEPILWMTLADFVVVVIWVVFTRWLYVKVFPPRKVLVIYGQYSPDNLIKKLEKRKDEHLIDKIVSIDNDLDFIKKEMLNYRNVILTDIPAELRNEILKFCFAQNIRCYSVPKISDIMIKSATNIHLFDTSLLLFRNFSLTAEQQFLKRIFDIFASLVAIILASPLMLIISLAIFLYDRGPVIFTQDRLTRDGKTFKIYKFRSMRVSEDEEYCLTRKEDERITPIGRIIRAVHFDELPQLFNILKGEMSVVGPRPECPILAEEYSENVPEFGFRLKVKAGLTGYAQVYGKYNTTPYDKLKLDLTYIQNYSFLLDLKIIVLTLKILFEKENTEGIDNDQTTALVDNLLSDSNNVEDDDTK
ncbi:MAG: exopolysaccharide biosynthesis polyprenyl glycosylphosphotransferase [Ruminococcaceae bacterium]|nr:exopolysaccharide biosynthesis polyprenyl glycosylphosphotransferase [Oscillospiraceae bacterium]